MRELFRIESDRASLVWRDAGSSNPVAHGPPVPGRLQVRPRATSASDPVVTVGGVATHSEAGPRLYEQRDYLVFAKAKDGHAVAVGHRDPLLQRGFASEDGGGTVVGRVNFGSQIGRTVFTLLVDQVPEFDVEIEVFPTKLDYETDYEELLAQVQSILTGLAFEYLRSTYQLGLQFSAPPPTELEWILLLQHVAAELERALRHVANRPVRGLMREERPMVAARVRRVDSFLRSAVRRGKGFGGFLPTAAGLRLRERVNDRRARPTLDTPEHRWLAHQVDVIRQRVARLREQESTRVRTKRSEQVLLELETLEGRLSRLAVLEPLLAAEGLPPHGFASLQLVGAPGYREAYQHCMVLSLGLRIEGGPLNLGVKDLSELYEYWCYLAVVRLVGEELEQEVDLSDLVAIQRDGLRVQLERGRSTRIPFRQSEDRKVTVTYNPRFQGGEMLIPQKPDILVTLEDGHWPALHLVLDAKYRVDSSPEYVEAYQAAGPPQDALNVLHRYRDAILERQPRERHERTVVQAAALFPSSEAPAAFRATRLWRALEQIGIGALPALPNNTDLLREWIRAALRASGWRVADRAPRHAAVERSHAWRQSAARPVLLGVLRGEDPKGHLDWVAAQRLYYMPKLENQPRQYRATHVLLYSPAPLRKPGAVTHVAAVQEIEEVSRADIATPWAASDRGRRHILYRLDRLRQVDRPIENVRGERVSAHRWTTELAMLRAKELSELLLETEPEWRLVEALRVERVKFTLEAGHVDMPDPDNPRGRTWIDVGSRRARFGGASGFVIEDETSARRLAPDVESTLDFLAIVERGKA